MIAHTGDRMEHVGVVSPVGGTQGLSEHLLLGVKVIVGLLENHSNVCGVGIVP